MKLPKCQFFGSSQGFLGSRAEILGAAMRRKFGEKNEGFELVQLSLAANMLGKERLQPVKTY